MAFPTFPSSWSAPTTCFSSTDIWAVIYSRDPADSDVVAWSDFLGVPATTPTGDCLPPSYATSAPYFGQTCPPGYRDAVASFTTISNQQAHAVLCCPGTDYSFAASGTAGCQTVRDDNEAFIATWTDPKNGEQRATTFTASDDLFAFGITIISTSSSATPSSSSSETSPSSSSETPSSSSPVVPTNSATASNSSPRSTGLSSGAAAGIGIGVGLAVILLTLVGWFLFRRRGRQTANDPVTRDDNMRQSAPVTITSPAMFVPEDGPGSQSPTYQAQKFVYSSPTDVQGRPTSELPT